MKRDKKFVLLILVLCLGGFFLFAKMFKADQEKGIIQTPRVNTADLVKDHSPTVGDKTAPVYLVEFLDPECEACKMMDPIVKGLLKEYEGKVFFVVRYMPFHSNSMLAAVSLEEAREQGKYWQALSNLFYHQPEWGSHHDPKPELIAKYITDLGVKLPDQKELLKKHQWKVDLDQADGIKAGVKATPTFFVNGRILDQIGYQELKSAIDKELSSPVR